MKHPNTIRPINEKLIAKFPHVTCDKPRRLHFSKKYFSKEYLEWILSTCLPRADHKCGDVLFHNNNVILGMIVCVQ